MTPLEREAQASVRLDGETQSEPTLLERFPLVPPQGPFADWFPEAYQDGLQRQRAADLWAMAELLGGILGGAPDSEGYIDVNSLMAALWWLHQQLEAAA